MWGDRVYLMKNVRHELAAAVRAASYGKMKLLPEAVQALVHAALQAKETDTLTERAREVLRLMVDGRNNAEIAERMVVSPSTDKYHTSNLLMKLGVDNQGTTVWMPIQKNV